MTQSDHDIAVVGGGVIGLTIAWALARRGRRVAIIDAGAERPAATHAAAGMLAPSFEREAGAMNSALYDFSRRSLKRWASFAVDLQAASGAAIDYRADGALGVAFTDPDAQSLREQYARLAAAGAPVQWLDGAAARSVEPALAGDVCAGMMAEDNGQVDPRRVVAALKTVLSRMPGVDFLAAQASSVSAAAGGARISLRNGAAIDAERVVIASGAGGLAGVPATGRLIPVKGEALAVGAPAKLLHHVVRAPGAYLCPKADGRIVIGASELRADDLGVDPDRIAELRAGADRAAPALAGLAEVERWAGLRPGTPDGAPIIGPAAETGGAVILALGHYRNGVLLAPATADHVAALLDGAADDRWRAFGPERFTDA